jgi:uncharacterized membrane protein
MTPLILFAVSAVIFLILDALMLTFVMRPLFEVHIKDLMLDSPRYVPAVVFYLGYVAGLTYLISWPALKTDAPIIIPAAIVGVMAYGTYELTSYTIMKAWHPTIVLVDMTWGTIATALVAYGGVMITRAITGGTV